MGLRVSPGPPTQNTPPVTATVPTLRYDHEGSKLNVPKKEFLPNNHTLNLVAYFNLSLLEPIEAVSVIYSSILEFYCGLKG